MVYIRLLRKSSSASRMSEFVSDRSPSGRLAGCRVRSRSASPRTTLLGLLPLFARLVEFAAPAEARTRPKSSRTGRPASRNRPTGTRTRARDDFQKRVMVGPWIREDSAGPSAAGIAQGANGRRAFPEESPKSSRATDHNPGHRPRPADSSRRKENPHLAAPRCCERTPPRRLRRERRLHRALTCKVHARRLRAWPR